MRRTKSLKPDDDMDNIVGYANVELVLMASFVLVMSNVVANHSCIVFVCEVLIEAFIMFSWLSLCHINLQTIAQPAWNEIL